MSEACLGCGACCAAFRVSFYWAEADARMNGRVPEELGTKISPHYVAMRGTDGKHPRCIALDGSIGARVSCTIYENRSSACRQFAARGARCNQARAWHGLPPLEASLEPERDAQGAEQ